MRRSLLIIIFFILTGTIQPWHEKDYYFVKFGSPIVSDNHIVFSGSGSQPHRLICISKPEVRKLWDIKDKKHILRPWFIMEKELVVTKDSDIYLCNLSSGNLKLIYKSGFAQCSLQHLKDTLVLLQGEKGDVDYLSCVDLKQSKELWRTPGVCAIIARSTKMLCIQRAKRIRNSSVGYILREVQVCGMTVEDGKICWTYPAPKDNFYLQGVAQKDFFIVELSGLVKCYRQGDGKLMNSISFGQDSSVAICAYKSDVLTWVQFFLDDSSLDESSFDKLFGQAIYSLSIPELEKKEVFKPDWGAAEAETHGDIIIGETIGTIAAYHIPTGRKIWHGGQWDWSGVQNGFIYFSNQEPKGDLITINQINVKTGERKRLYGEPLKAER